MSGKKTIRYAYPIESVSRKFTLRKNVCSLSNGAGVFNEEPAQFMGGGVRKAARFGVGDPKVNFMFVRMNARTSAKSAQEQTLHNMFTQASKLRKAWKSDLSTMATVLEDWKAAGNGSAKGVHKAGYTFGGWMFAVAYAVIADGGTVASQFPPYSAA